MIKQYKTTLFIFRRDFRLHDNTALINATSLSETVIPIFIFDPRQITDRNTYKSKNAIQFMIESLIDLEQQLKKERGNLYYFYGNPENIVEKIYKKCTFEALFINKDYTPFSIKRDKYLEQFCKKNGINLKEFHDISLHEPEKIKKDDSSLYSVFTPFLKKGIALGNIPTPKPISKVTWYKETIPNSLNHEIFKKVLHTYNNHIHVHGGRKFALEVLSKIPDLKNYTKTHDFPSIPTSNLSAYLKFGCISIREAYHVTGEILGYTHPLIRQLYWHDFYIYIACHNSHVYGHAFHEKYDQLPWNNSKKDFTKWCSGNTGFPIVDAGMRQLNTTGYIHNRIRMIVASFLTKDLHIDWQKGEQYFAQHLVDYDPAINNGNWQWVASTGCDPQPYFRIFNPWLQQKKFDPECIYIKKWIPELKSVSPNIIHKWYAVKNRKEIDYPGPMLDHKKESERAKKIYKSMT